MKNAIWHENFQSCFMKIGLMDFYIYLIDLSCTFSCQTKQLRSCVKLQFFSHFAIEVFIQHFCIRMSTNAHFIYQGIINQYILCPNSLFIVVFGWTKNHSQTYEYMPSTVSYKWKLSEILYFLLHAFDIYIDSLIFVVSAR